MSPVHRPSLQLVQKWAYFVDDTNRVFCAENGISNFMAVLGNLDAAGIPASLDDLSVPYILPRSVDLRYQENAGKDEIQDWAFLSENREYEERFDPLMDQLRRSDVNSSQLSPLLESTKSHSRVNVNQSIAVSFTLQNPLNETLSIQEMKLQVTEPEAVSLQSLRFEMKPFEVKKVTLFASPIIPISFTIKGVFFSLSPTISFTQSLSLPRIRLNRTLSQRQCPTYAQSHRLTVDVLPTNIAASCEVHVLSFHDSIDERIRGDTLRFRTDLFDILRKKPWGSSYSRNLVVNRQ